MLTAADQVPPTPREKRFCTPPALLARSHPKPRILQPGPESGNPKPSSRKADAPNPQKPNSHNKESGLVNGESGGAGRCGQDARRALPATARRQEQSGVCVCVCVCLMLPLCSLPFCLPRHVSNLVRLFGTAADYHVSAPLVTRHFSFSLVSLRHLQHTL